MSAFKESRDRSRGHGNFLSLVDGKSRDDQEDTCVDIDLTMDIVKDFSDEIFSNIEQLNRNSLIATNNADTNGDKHCVTAIVHIEDESDTYRYNNKHDTLTRDNERSADVKNKSKEGDSEKTEAGEDGKTLLERRRVSLPEITSLPNIRAIRIR